MFCNKCGCMYDERENTVCPACGGKNQVNSNVNNADVYSNVNNTGVYGNVSNTGTYSSNMTDGQAAMHNMPLGGRQTKGTWYQQWAGKYYPGLSRGDLFGFRWLKKYDTAVRVPSVFMYIFETFLWVWMIITAVTLSDVRYYNGYGIRRYNDGAMAICIVAIIVISISLILSIIGHLMNSRVASGVAMGICIICTIILTALVGIICMLFGLVMVGVSVAVFVSDIIYNAKWNRYKDTGIIPIR